MVFLKTYSLDQFWFNFGEVLAGLGWFWIRFGAPGRSNIVPSDPFRQPYSGSWGSPEPRKAARDDFGKYWGRRRTDFGSRKASRDDFGTVFLGPCHAAGSVAKIWLRIDTNIVFGNLCVASHARSLAHCRMHWLLLLLLLLLLWWLFLLLVVVVVVVGKGLWGELPIVDLSLYKGSSPPPQVWTGFDF